MPRRKKLVDEMKELQAKEIEKENKSIGEPETATEPPKPKRTRKPKAAAATQATPEVAPEIKAPKKNRKTITSEIKAKDFSDSLSGIYKVTANLLNLRFGPGKSFGVMTTMPKGALVSNSGYFTNVSGEKWIYATYTDAKENTVYCGYCNSDFLQK